MFVPICTHALEFDSFYRAEIYGRPSTVTYYLFKKGKIKIKMQNMNKKIIQNLACKFNVKDDKTAEFEH